VVVTLELLAAERVSSLVLVAYQKGAVVSRTLLQRATGTVMVFAFDQDQGLSEHTAPFDALVQVLEGEAEVVIAGQAHHVSAGEMILSRLSNRTRSRRELPSRCC
jgi:quercetin dioxygenase-like cupin family protein